LKKALAVFSFEYIGLWKSRAFLATTFILLGVVAITTSFPRISAIFSGEKGVPTAVLMADEALFDPIRNAVPEFSWDLGTDPSRAEALVSSGRCQIAVVYDGSDYTLYAMDYDFDAYTVVDKLNELFTLAKREALIGGMSASHAESVRKTLDTSVKGEIKTIGGGDAYGNYPVAYFMITFLYAAILMFGMLVINTVVSEKASRAMELLIVSANPSELMFGKVFAVACAGLTQLFVLIFATFLFTGVNITYWSEFSPSVVTQIGSSTLSFPLVGMFIMFFLLGFFNIAFINAALASTVSRAEDSNAVSTISLLIGVASFFAAIVAIRTVDSAWVKVLSYIPPFSAFLMITRLSMGAASYLEAFLSVLILAASVVGLGVLAAKIYRLGVTMYGQPFSIATIFKMLAGNKGGKDEAK
jgi:ABC-2 type transport system permease protein